MNKVDNIWSYVGAVLAVMSIAFFIFALLGNETVLTQWVAAIGLLIIGSLLGADDEDSKRKEIRRTSR